MRSISIVILTAATLSAIACTPDGYRRDADRQVQALIKERQQRTTDYTPEVKVDPTTQPTPTKKSYNSIPVTRTPADELMPAKRVGFTLAAEPLGPPSPESWALEIPDVEEMIAGRALEIFRPRLEFGPPGEIGKTLKFELFDCVNYAVQHSRSYQTEMERLYLSALDVTLQRHLFSPRPFAQVGVNYEGGQQSVEYRSAYTVTGRAGVRQRLPYGGEIVAEGLVNFVNAISDNVTDGEDAQLALRGSIPLLRGAGLINLEPLIASERELIYATRQFEEFRRAFAVEVSTRYFRVLTRYTALRNRFINYNNLSLLTARSEALFEAGRVNALEVQRAQQDLLSAEDSLQQAQQSLASDLDDFKIFIGMPVDQPLDLVMIDVEMKYLESNVGEPEGLALAYRLDLQTARDRVEDGRRGVANAQNLLGPGLNLDAGATVGNQEGDPARKIDGRTVEYNAGLTLDLPVDRLPERNVYRQRLIVLDQARRSQVELEQNILADVRAAQRNIRSAQLSLEIQRRAIELARERLEFANESLLLGRLNNSRDVTDAQRSLLTAQDSYDQARANLQIQLLQFLRDTGMLRVDPKAGALGLAMDRRGMPWSDKTDITEGVSPQ